MCEEIKTPKMTSCFCTAKVTITRGPPKLVSLSVGDLFNVTCYTVGTPTPEVVWRFNWSYVPSKCSSSSKNGIGILTCPDIQVSFLRFALLMTL